MTPLMSGSSPSLHQKLLISTLRKPGQIIGEYIEPGPRDAEQTLSRLIALLERQDLARAIERIGRVASGEMKDCYLAVDQGAGSAASDVSGNSLISRTSTRSLGRYR